MKKYKFLKLFQYLYFNSGYSKGAKNGEGKTKETSFWLLVSMVVNTIIGKKKTELF